MTGRATPLASWLMSARCCLSLSDFRGAPDALRGDSPNARVRDEAKECMNAVFNGPAVKSGGSSAATGRIEGYGGGGDATQGSPTSEMAGGGRANNYGYGDGTYSASAADRERERERVPGPPGGGEHRGRADRRPLPGDLPLHQ